MDIQKINQLRMDFETPMMDAWGAQLAAERDKDYGKMGDWSEKEVHEQDNQLIITVGVKDGVAFMSHTQLNMQTWEDYAEIRRMQYREASASERTKLMGLEKWGLPWVIKMELELRGYPVDEIIRSGDHRDLDQVMADEFEDLLWVPKKAMRLQGNKKIFLPTGDR